MNSVANATGYLVGVDLGERNDYTAVVVLRQHTVPTGRIARQYVGFDMIEGSVYEDGPEFESRYDVIYADRWRRKGYKVLPSFLDTLTNHLRQETHQQRWDAGILNQPDPPVWVLVDATSVGIPVIENLRAAGVDCVGVTFTGGAEAHRRGEDWTVPKAMMVSHLKVLVENQRLQVYEGLPLASTLKAEFHNFRSKRRLDSGRESYEAGTDVLWREGEHDDLVNAAAMVAWYGEGVDPARSQSNYQDIANAMMMELS